MARKWFVSQNDHVYGPWNTEDVRAHLREGGVSSRDLIWGAPEAQWRPLGEWSGQDVVEEATFTNAEEAWHYAREGQSFGPFPRASLLVELRRLDSLSDVSMWTRGMADWASIYEFPELLDELGVDKRQYPRAAIDGRVVMKYDGLTRVASLASLSEGGCGLRLDTEMFAGTSVQLELQHPSFAAPVFANAEVRYLSRGILGMRFVGLDASARSAIVSYVRANSHRMIVNAA